MQQSQVARLYTSGDFAKSLAQQFEGGVRLKFYLAPPIFARRDKVSGHLRKREFGPWMMTAFKVLSRFKGLRGTAFDIFGRTAERRMERRLIGEFEAELAGIASGLSPENLEHALNIAKLPLEIRGYGHVKEEAVQVYRGKLQELKAGALAATGSNVSPSAAPEDGLAERGADRVAAAPIR